MFEILQKYLSLVLVGACLSIGIYAVWETHEARAYEAQANACAISYNQLSQQVTDQNKAIKIQGDAQKQVAIAVAAAATTNKAAAVKASAKIQAINHTEVAPTCQGAMKLLRDNVPSLSAWPSSVSPAVPAKP